MSQQALQLVQSDLEQADSSSSVDLLQAEAARLTAWAAGYGLFGAKLDYEPEADEYGWPMPAVDAYRADDFETPVAANESEPEAANFASLNDTTLNALAPSYPEAIALVVEIVEDAAPAPLGEQLVDIVELVTTPIVDAEPEQVEAPVEPTPAGRAAFPTLAQRRVRIAPIHATRLIQAVDWLVVLFAAQYAALWATGGSLELLALADAAIFLIAAGALKAGLWLTNIYKTPPSRLSPEHGAAGLALGAIAGIIIAAIAAPDARATASLALIVPFAALLLAGIHAAFALWIRAGHRAGLFSETIVVVGATEAAQRLAQRAAERGDARVVAIVDDRLARSPHKLGGTPVTGDINDLLAWQSLPNVDRIVITVTQKAETRVRSLIERLRVLPNRVDLLLDYDTLSVRGRKLDRLTGAAMACVSGRPHNAGRALLKRTQDLVLGAAALVLFAPVMALIALAVKLDSKGPALYRQRRHGFNNRIITVLKFRTMRDDPDAVLKQVERNDPRITRIGAFLRRTSLDELPQLINVLRGEMSLVGPRPHAVGMRAADRDLSHIVSEYAHRHRVKPGITGWAQVNGSRGPIETPGAVRERVKLDLDYVANASLWLDLFIIVRTIPALFGDRKVTR